MFFRAIALLIALAAGLAASQAREFAQQYRQRLGGAVDELVVEPQQVVLGESEAADGWLRF